MTNDELREPGGHRPARQSASLPISASASTSRARTCRRNRSRPVRPTFLLLALALAAAPALAHAETAVTDRAVMAFRDICLATAPSFDRAMAAARKFGVKPDRDLASGAFGVAPDEAFSIQVRARKECAVTAERSPGPDVEEQFLAVVAKAGGLPLDGLRAGVPITLTLQGRTYVVRHDRRGAEAYVISDAAAL